LWAIDQHNDVVRIQPPLHSDRRRLAGELIDDVEHPDFAAIMRAVLYKIISQDMVGSLWPQSNAGAIVQPEAPTLWLVLQNL
jgi:hypothetical protein